MSSKTILISLPADILWGLRTNPTGHLRGGYILIGLSIFWFAGEKSVHGRPSWELAPYDCSSQNTVSEDFAAWCKLVSKEFRFNSFNDRAGKYGVVRFITQFFLIWTRPKHSLFRI